jgi:hypothetical protein
MPGKPAHNNIVFYRRRMHETLFSICLHRGSLDAFCVPTSLALVPSLHINIAHLTQLTLLSACLVALLPPPDAWPWLLHTPPALTSLCLCVTKLI